MNNLQQRATQYAAEARTLADKERFEELARMAGEFVFVDLQKTVSFNQTFGVATGEDK